MTVEAELSELSGHLRRLEAELPEICVSSRSPPKGSLTGQSRPIAGCT